MQNFGQILLDFHEISPEFHVNFELLKSRGLPGFFRTFFSFFPGRCPPLCGLLASNFQRVSLRPLSATLATGGTDAIEAASRETARGTGWKSRAVTTPTKRQNMAPQNLLEAYGRLSLSVTAASSNPRFQLERRRSNAVALWTQSKLVITLSFRTCHFSFKIIARKVGNVLHVLIKYFAVCRTLMAANSI